MKPFQHLSTPGFRKAEEQPDNASDYVGRAGIFRVRVRVPVDHTVRPVVWVGFTAGAPLVERPSSIRYRDAMHAMDDAAFLLRLFASTYRG